VQYGRLVFDLSGITIKFITMEEPLNKTDFGKLIIAKSYIKELKCQIGQLESEVAHLTHVISETKNIDKLRKDKAELLEWLTENRKDIQRDSASKTHVIVLKKTIKELREDIKKLRKVNEGLIIKLNRIQS
jgi:predicted RNase H-like nuclease (RuvC/YqgF family)